MSSLSQIIDIKNGKSIKSKKGKYPIYGGNGIIGYSDNYNYEKIIIIGRVGANCGSIHIENGKCFVSDNALAGLPKNLSNEFNYYLLKSLKLNAKQIGSSQPLLTQGILNNLEISYPENLIAQQKIASILSALDNKIELNNRINAELEAMAKTLYDYWFVQFDFPVSGTLASTPLSQQSVAERSRGYKSSGGKMVYNETLKREIPEGWEVETIGDLGNIIGGSTPSKMIKANFTDDGTPWITPKDLSLNIGNKFITKGEFDVSEKGLKEVSLRILPKNSVLMSSRAPIGYIAINRTNCTTNQGFKSIICDKEYSCEYIFYVLNYYMPSIKANASGSTFKEISASVLKSINIIKPQKKIVLDFVEIIKPIFEKQDNLEKQNQELSALRDWLLPMLMNGQVKV